MGKKVKGRKRHMLVDTLGLMLVMLVHSADVQDRTSLQIAVHSPAGQWAVLQMC